MNRKNILKVTIPVLGMVLCSIVGYFLIHKYFFSPQIIPSCQDCNILLISLDTCGAKHMSTYGYGRDTTPNLTALAKEGILFTNMHANATWTLPSHVSMFTGLYPMVHKMVVGFPPAMDTNIPLLPDILQKNGYETYFYVTEDEQTFPQKNIYNRGIAHWTENYSYRNYEALPEILGRLNTKEEQKKKFIFYHSYACHAPYFIENQPLRYAAEPVLPIPLQSKDLDMANEPTEVFLQYVTERMPKGLADGDFKIAPGEIRQFIENLKSAPDFMTKKRIYREAIDQKLWGEQSQFSYYYESFFYWQKIDPQNTKHVDYIKALYDQQMRIMDGTILKSLYTAGQSGALNNTIVVITADHGEEFMEHGELQHTTLYDYNTDVPLVVLVPGVHKKVIQEHVQSVDIMPTILELVGVKESFKFNGKSLVPLLSGGSLGKRLIITYVNALQQETVSIRENDWKMFALINTEGSVFPFSLYNTKQDTSEKTNILTGNINRVMDMVQQYQLLKTNTPGVY